MTQDNNDYVFSRVLRVIFPRSPELRKLSNQGIGLLLFDEGVYSAGGGVVVFNGTNYCNFWDKRFITFKKLTIGN